jgi:virginiamycin A acetyltransferase
VSDGESGAPGGPEATESTQPDEPAERDLAPPDPGVLHPIPGSPRTGFIRNLADLPANVEIGEYTYYDDPGGPEAFRANVLYHFEFSGDRLVIGRYCALASGTRFIMNGANHRMSGLSTFPFPIFGAAWRGRWAGELDFPTRGDTRVGNDVWIGYDSLVMPGITIGNGAVIASRSVVTSDVPAYAVVGGNPARVIRQRFDDAAVARLESLRWWDWPAEVITDALPILSGTVDLDALEAFAWERGLPR